MRKFLFCVVLTAFQMSGQNSNEIIQNIVKNQIEINLSKIPEGKENLFGFNSRNDFKNCKAGDPIRVVTLVDDALVELNEWRVPIVLDGRNKLFFTIQKNSVDYEIVDIGGVELAQEIQKIKIDNVPVKYLIRLHRLHIDFVSKGFSSNLDEEVIVPLQSARIFLSSNIVFSEKRFFSFQNLLVITKL
jgi:hypothetical protein